MAAYALTKAGADVVVPRPVSPGQRERLGDADVAYESPRRGRSTKERPFGEFDACIGGWNSLASRTPGRRVPSSPGGAPAWWAAEPTIGAAFPSASGPYDFKRKSRDGLGDDWPISYDDVAPYYDQIDRLIGVFGSKESLPNEPNGVFLPPPLPRCHELLVKQAADRLHVTCIPARLSILTRPLNGRADVPLLRPMQPRLPRSTRTHRYERADCACPRHGEAHPPHERRWRARCWWMQAAARPRGLHRQATGSDRRVRAKVVVLAASAVETARLLLNSTSSRFPNGLANSSGHRRQVHHRYTGTTSAGSSRR